MRVESSIEIKAPPEKVWPFLVEPEKVLQWVVTFREFEYPGEQRSGAGTRIYIEEQAGGPLMKLNFEVTDWVENVKLAYSLTSGNMVKNYRVVEIIEAIEEGSRFTFMEEFNLPWGFLGRLIESAGRKTGERHVRDSLLKLKSLAEA